MLPTYPAKLENRVIMKDLHPEQIDLPHPHNCEMFLSHHHKLTTKLQSQQFQTLLRIDATTSAGLQYVAEYFKVEQKWETKKQTNILQAYFESLCLVKQASMEDNIWISF
jgi:hypothetical protein